MMNPYMMGGYGGGAGIGFIAILWLFWVLIWTFNSVMVGMALVALVKYLQSKTK